MNIYGVRVMTDLDVDGGTAGLWGAVIASAIDGQRQDHPDVRGLAWCHDGYVWSWRMQVRASDAAGASVAAFAAARASAPAKWDMTKAHVDATCMHPSHPDYDAEWASGSLEGSPS